MHHVRDDDSSPLPWDLGFLAFGAILVVGGLWLFRNADQASAADERTVEAVESGAPPTNPAP